MNRRSVLAIGVCVSLLIMVSSPSVSAVSSQTFRNCSQLLKKYKWGVAQNRGVAGDLRNKIHVLPKVYQTNKRLDTDKDGVACEKESLQHIDVLARRVYDIVLEALAVGPSSTSKIECLTEASGYKRLISEACLDGSRAAEFFSKLGFPLPAKTFVVFSQTDAGLRRIALKKGCEQPSLQISGLGLGGSAIPGKCRNGEVIVTAGRIQDWATQQGPTIGFHHVVPHELFHQWQMTNTSYCVSWQCGNTDFPKWLFEGTPQFMTRFVYWSWNRSKDPSQWQDYWFKVENPDLSKMCKGVSIEQMVDPVAPWPNSNWCAYIKGPIAIEVLVANYGGFEALRKLHTTKTTPGHQDFETYFKIVTGRDISEFYSEVNSYFRTRNWP